MSEENCATEGERYYESGDIVCIRLRIKRELLERIDKDFHGYKSRNGFMEFIIKSFLDKRDEP